MSCHHTRAEHLSPIILPVIIPTLRAEGVTTITLAFDDGSSVTVGTGDATLERLVAEFSR